MWLKAEIKMPNEVISMSKRELSRLEIIQQIQNKQLTQIDAAKHLKISTRQLRRLQKDFAKLGVIGLQSKHRKKPSNNKISVNVITRALELLRTDYIGFAPTFAAEKLLEHHQLVISKETLRKLMIKHGLWTPKQRRRIKPHQMRARRSCFGELVQADGSPHDWFEGRGDACCLLVFIDDATSKIVEMRFVPVESTEAYFDALENYIKRYGRPLALYTDKHGIFRVNAVEAEKTTGDTQFSRACRELDIELICAHSPQAKGRVERANKTMQDRLVKEMRLKNICTIEAANAFLPEFIEKHNQRFAKEPASPQDAHRKTLPNDETLQLILSHQTTRILSKNLELSYNNIIYQIQTDSPSYAMRKASIQVCDRQNNIKLIYKNQFLTYKTFDKKNRPSKIIDAKQINAVINKKIKHKPAEDHPWRNYPAQLKVA